MALHEQSVGITDEWYTPPHAFRALGASFDIDVASPCRNVTIEEKLLEVHGEGDCHICGKPRAGKGSDICSYPHGMLPPAPIDKNHPEGFWGWERPSR